MLHDFLRNHKEQLRQFCRSHFFVRRDETRGAQAATKGEADEVRRSSRFVEPLGEATTTQAPDLRPKKSLLETCRKWFQTHRHSLLTYARQQADKVTDVELLLADVTRAVTRLICEGRLEFKAIEPYCLRCIRNAAAAQRQQNIRRKEAETRYTDESIFQERLLNEQMTEPEDVHIRLRQAVQQLPEELSEIVTLRLWGELSFSEISQKTGLPESTLRRKYAAAVIQVGRMIDKNESK